jgi:tetratricopeptide (TPR) repeat protein
LTAAQAAGSTGMAAVVDRLAEAKKLISSARFAEAESLLQALLAGGIERHHELEARYALAVSRRYRKDYPGANQALDELLAIAPDHSRAYQERGHTLLAENRPEEAAGAYAKAVDGNPGLLASWKALANLHERAGRAERARVAKAQADYLTSLPMELQGVIDLIYEGRLLKAERLCRQFLKQNRQHVEGMRLLADIGVRLKVYDDAEFLLESCVEFEPDNLRARTDYLRILNRKGKFEKAYEQARILCDAQPDNPTYQLSLGSALIGLGHFEEGLEQYRQCLETAPNKAGVHVLMGHALKAVGRLDEAVMAYRSAWQLRPDYGDAFWSLANTKTYRFSDEEMWHIRQHETDPGVSADDRIHLCFAAGKAFEDRGDFDTSFEYYERGNALKRERSGYDPDRTTQMVDDQIQVCTRKLFERHDHVGFDCPDPVFIVGLPRAGSTLLEQILASHSQVDGTMELHDILALAQRLSGRSAEDTRRYPAILNELDDDYFRRFGEQYIENTRAYRGTAPFFIDKMPNNFMHVGLIRLILPRAKVIDARRHPLACCFSGFKQLFGEGQDFTYGLEPIGRYYRDYVRLMDHWDRVLPGFVLRIRHEDVVEDLETQVRRMLDFCGLPFEPACLDFHATDRSVRTPSSEQVRQPIYRTGLDHWRNYEPWLAPLRQALGDALVEAY